MTSNAPTAEDIWRALSSIPDPEFGINIVDLGLIYDVEIIDRHVTVTMTLTTSTCPSGGWIQEGVGAAVQALPDVATVKVNVVFDPAWTPEMLSDAARRQIGAA